MYAEQIAPPIDKLISATLMTKTASKKPERIPQGVIDSLLESVQLLDLVKESTQVVSIGIKHTALCPFHAQKDSVKSLIIDVREQRFSCTVCDFHGSAIGWLMFHDGLPFQDSILELSQRSNIDVSQWISVESITNSRIDKKSALNEVELFFSKQISGSDEASQYIASRGLCNTTLEHYGIGYAAEDGNVFDEQFGKHSRTLWNNGLLVRLKDGKFGRRFRNRLMFPIRDKEGYTVGFGGRSLGEGQPKYLNSPSSPTFNKSKLLYGLYESLRAPNESGRLILVEGYIDVLTLSQYGFKGAVATLGTSPSECHIKSVFENADSMIACFDGDTAGQKAAWRLLITALPYLMCGNQMKFAILPPGHDPDSLLRSKGVKNFEGILDSAVGVEQFLHDTLAIAVDTNSIGGKAKLAADARPIVESINSVSLRRSAIDLLEDTIGIPWFDHPSV